MAVPADPYTVDNPTPGQPIPAAYMDLLRDWVMFLSDPPACSVFNTTAQSVATGTTAVALTADSENKDTDSMHSTGSNTSRITFQTAGSYVIQATVEYASNATGYRSTSFAVNGTASPIGGSAGPAATGVVTRHVIVRTVEAVVGDYVETLAEQTSGGNLNVTLREFRAKWDGR